MSLAFANERIEPISVSLDKNAETILPVEVKIYPIKYGVITVVTPEKSICEEGVVSNITIEVDCDEGGGYFWSGKICYEHIEALVEQFQESC